MSVLFVSSFALFRGTRFGGAKRLYYVARELERAGGLSLICLDGCGELQGRDPRPEFAHALFLHGLPVEHDKGSLRLPFDIARELAGRRDGIERFLEGRTFDGLLLAFPQSLGFLELGLRERCRKIVYAEDDLVVEQYRKAALAAPRGLGRLARRLRYWQASRYLRRKLRGASGLIAISAEEEAVLAASFPGTPIRRLRYGLDLEEYPVLPRPADPLTLGYIGNYSHKPNLDALEYFLGEILPYLREQEPGLKMVVAGKGIPAALRGAQGGRGSLVFMEDVDRVEDFYRSIGIFVNPIISGRGMRTKLIECAAFGRPIVSTPLGAEGAEDLRISLASDAPEFLAAIRGLAAADEYGRAAARNRDVVERNYDIRRTVREALELLE